MTVEDLEQYGMSRMTDDEIHQLLSNQETGVLALPTDGVPSVRPMSFWFDGESAVYFTYVGGSESRKAAATAQASAARFLVYRTETPFNWRSALLTGPIEEVPDDEQTAVVDRMELAWRPEAFEQAEDSTATTLYRLQITDREGLKQVERSTAFSTSDTHD